MLIDFKGAFGRFFCAIRTAVSISNARKILFPNKIAHISIPFYIAMQAVVENFATQHIFVFLYLPNE